MSSGADSRHFFVAMVPPTATKQEHEVSCVRAANGKWKPKFRPSDAWAAAEDALKAHLERFRPDAPITDGGVVLSVEWCFPTDGHADGEPYLGRPDTDNLEKGLKDVMTDLEWWDDDARVFAESVVKLHSAVPGIRIDIEEVALP